MHTVGITLLSLVAVLFSNGILQAAEILAGPMIGHTTPTSARIWVETDQPARVTIDYFHDPRRFAVYTHATESNEEALRAKLLRMPHSPLWLSLRASPPAQRSITRFP